MSRKGRRPAADNGGDGNERGAGRRLSGKTSTDWRVTWNHEPSMWLRAAIRAAGPNPSLLRDVRVCTHVPLAADVFTAAWWPQTFVCAACGLPPLTGDDDFRCDRCGVVDRPELRVLTVAVPFQSLRPQTFWFSVGLCRDCLRREAVDA